MNLSLELQQMLLVMHSVYGYSVEEIVNLLEIDEEIIEKVLKDHKTWRKSSPNKLCFVCNISLGSRFAGKVVGLLCEPCSVSREQFISSRK